MSISPRRTPDLEEGNVSVQDSSSNNLAVNDMEHQNACKTSGATSPVLTCEWFPRIKAGEHCTGLSIKLDDLTKLKALRAERHFQKPNPGPCIFLCLREGAERYAIKVPCCRPILKRATECTFRGSWTDVKKYDDRAKRPEETVCESDSMIYHRIREACYRVHGKWKRCVPYYGVVEVREVRIEYFTARQVAGRYPIKVKDLDIDATRKRLNVGISHTKDCKEQTVLYGLPCIDTKQRKELLSDLPLLRTYVQNPWIAEAHTEAQVSARPNKKRSTLQGLAQESFVLDKYVPIFQLKLTTNVQNDDLRDRMRDGDLPALEVVLGWQTKRFLSDLPPVWIWAVIGFIWIIVVVFGLVFANWSVSVGLGQLVAALATILLAASRL